MWCLFDMCTEITEGFRFNGAHLQVTLSEGEHGDHEFITKFK